MWKETINQVLQLKHPNEASVAQQISWEIEVKFLLSKAA